MRPIKVKWKTLDLELPGEVALFLLIKLFALLLLLGHF